MLDCASAAQALHLIGWGLGCILRRRRVSISFFSPLSGSFWVIFVFAARARHLIGWGLGRITHGGDVGADRHRFLSVIFPSLASWHVGGG